MTQCELLLKYLNNDGASITSYEAYSILFITQLGRCIDDLQKRGFSFQKTKEEHNGKHFVRYSLARSGEQIRMAI
jgi:hypothetical protein